MADVIAVVMAKLPEPSRVKTRLVPPLTPEQASAVHELFLRRVLGRLCDLSRRGSVLMTTLAFDSPTGGVRTDEQAFVLARSVGPVSVILQADGDLGERLTAVHERPAAEGCRSIILGADSPDLPDAHLEGAIALLNAHDLVLGPCDDGGFWCLGVAAGVDLRPVLADVEWSSGREMAQVRHNAEAAGLSVGLAGAWYDVDRPTDLAKLIVRLEGDPGGRPLLEALASLLPPALFRDLQNSGRQSQASP